VALARPGFESALHRAPAVEVLPRAMAAARTGSGFHSHALENSKSLLFVPCSGCGISDVCTASCIDGRNRRWNDSLHRQFGSMMAFTALVLFNPLFQNQNVYTCLASGVPNP